MRWRTSTITAIPLPPHQLARQRFNRFPEAPVTWHIEQLVDDLLQRRRINVTPERLRNFPDRVVGRRHAREIVLSGRDAGASVGSNAARFSARSVRALDRRFQPVRRTPQPTLRAVRGPRVVWRSPTARAIAGPSLERSWHRASSDSGSRIVHNYQHPAAAFVFALKPRSDAPAGEPADDTRLQAKRFQERPMQFRRRRCRRSGTLAFSSRYLSGGAPTVHVTRSSGAE
jgi:hypothetical protein